MLIYNFQKEFLGIDEEDLKNLGYNTLLELRSQSADFADLFVKTPGFIHNFKHVHWIDFITCADSTEVPKVIIHANGKSYRCNLNITTAYLTDNPSSKAYLVNLQNLRVLTTSENADIANDILTKPTPQAATTQSTPFKEEITTKYEHPAKIDIPDIVEDDFDTPDMQESSITLVEDIPLKSVEDQYNTEPIEISEPIDITKPLEIEIEENIQIDLEEEKEIKQEEIIEAPVEIEEFNSDYVFNPQIASDELGLPIDLIEEFIEDFIAQAKEFKDDLYQSVNDGDIDNVKILSHKLKGVAANLRVEDAFEILTTINTSADINVIKKNLGYLYTIIAKLSGEEIVAPKENRVQSSVDRDIVEDEDDFILEFKDSQETTQEENLESITLEPDFAEDITLETEDLLVIKDSQVPQKIDIPELADDDFLNSDSFSPIDQESLEVNIETVDETKLTEEVSNIDELPELIELDDSLELQADIDVKEDEELIQVDELTVEAVEIEYDKVKIANEIGLDSDSFNELFEDYIHESHTLCDSINNAIDLDNSTKWQKEALKLKGMSDNMRVNDFTSELEVLITTSDQDVATNAIDKITSVIETISE